MTCQGHSQGQPQGHNSQRVVDNYKNLVIGFYLSSLSSTGFETFRNGMVSLK